MSMPNQLPNILVNKVQDEVQDMSMISDVLEPNQNSQNTARFVIPKKATILDSLSSFVWRTEWGGYDSTKTDQVVVLKDFSGSLNTIRRCRLYVGQKLLMSQTQASTKMFMDNRFEEADTLAEIHDVKYGAMNDFFVNDLSTTSEAFSGQIELGRDAPDSMCGNNRRFTRKVGSGALGWETQLFLSDLFSGLKDISLPLSKMKEDVSIEIDFETNFDKVFYDATPTGATSGRITTSQKKVVISNPRLLCDYIQYDEGTDSALEQQVMGQGIVVPFRQTIVIERTLAPSTGTGVVEDIPLQLNQKALMKIMVQKLVSTGSTKVLGVGKAEAQGNSRSDALPNEKYNVLINDLLIYDRDIDTVSKQYAQLSQVGEKPYYAYPESMEFEAPDTADADADVLSGRKVVAGSNYSATTLTGGDAEKACVKSGQTGVLSFLGISLGKYGKNSGDTLVGASYRVGSSPVVIRYTRDGASASTFAGKSIKMNIFVDILRVLDLKSGFSDVRDQ